MKKLWLLAVLALALGAVAIGTSVASAGNSKVTAVTHVFNHPDTTSVSGTCTDSSANGPVWAYDNLSLRFVVTPEAAPGDYSVTIYANGSFAAISNPTTGDCYTGNGSVDGVIQYDVHSGNAPDPALLPAQSDGNLGQTALLTQLFGGDATVVGGGHYSYTYTQVAGSKYTQVG